MKRRFGLIFPVFLMALALSGCGEWYRPATGPIGESHRPKLLALWAPESVASGTELRIYLRATDPDGDLDAVQVIFGQRNLPYTPQLLVLPAAQRRRANGALATQATPYQYEAFTNTVYGWATVLVQDRAGNRSRPKTVAFLVRGYGAGGRAQPPKGFNRSVVLARPELPLVQNLRAK